MRRMLIVGIVFTLALGPTFSFAKDGSGPGSSAGGGNSGNGGGSSAGNGVGGGDGGHGGNSGGNGGNSGGNGGNGGNGGAGSGGSGGAGGGAASGGGTGGSGSGGSGGSGSGGAGGGAASAGAGAGSGAGAAGGDGGNGGAGAAGGDGGNGGGGISSVSVAGVPGDSNFAVASTDARSALGFRLARYARQGTVLLRPNQEWTYDVFTFCKSGDTSISLLKPDGGFSFDAIDATVARAQMRCMAAYGFTFDASIEESTNFGR